MSNANEPTKWRMWARDILIIVLGAGGVFGTFGNRAAPTPMPAVDIQPVVARIEKLEGTVSNHLQDRTLHLSVSDVTAQTSPIRSELEALKTGLAAQQKQLDRIERAIADLLDRELRKTQ